MRDERQEKFASMIAAAGSDECWEWKGAIAVSGYGVFNTGGKTEYAHRIAWSLAAGRDIPKGLVVRHKCDNRSCCNPNHLEIGTHADNSRDAYERGRGIKGETVHGCKLSRQEVVEVHRMLADGVLQKDIAKKFGVYQSTISDICTGNAWGWLRDEESKESE